MKSKKAALNILAKFANQLVALICGLITPRLILYSFGSTYNGAISSINQVLGFISILTAGLAGATRVELYKSLANNDIDSISRIIKATERFMHRVGYIILVYTAFLSLIYPFLFKGQLPWHELMFLVVIISSSIFAQNYFGYTYRILLQADQSEYISTSIYTVLHIVNTIAIIVIIRFGFSIFAVKVATAIVFTTYPVIVNMYVKKKYKLNLNCNGDTSAIKERSAAMFHSFANVIHNQTDTIILTIFTNAKTVSIYTIYYIVLNNVKQVMQNFVTGLEAAFGSWWAKEDIESFKRNFETYEFLMYSFSSVVFSCVWLMLVPFIKLYTNGVHDANYIQPMFAYTATFAEAIYCIRQPYVTIVQAAGKYRETRNGALFETIVNLVISIFMVFKFGLIGVIIGTLSANIIRTIQYAIYSSKHLLNRNIIYFIKRIIWHLINSIIVIYLYKIIFGNSIIESWTSWVVRGYFCFSLSMFITAVNSIIIYQNDLIKSFLVFKSIIRRNAHG